MDPALSQVATLGDTDGSRDAAFCDCGQLDLSSVLAACSPESLARLGESFLHTNLHFRQRFELGKEFCALCQVINTLWPKFNCAEDFSRVEVRIYHSSSISRTASDIIPRFTSSTPFLMIAFAPGGPPRGPPRGPLGRPQEWFQFKEYAFASTHKNNLLGFPRPVGRLEVNEPYTWEVHLECPLDQELNWEGIKMALIIGLPD